MMNEKEARAYIRDKVNTVDMVTAPGPVRAWAIDASDFLLVLDEAPAENVVSVIFNYGYIRGMEYEMHRAGREPFAEARCAFESAQAWKVLVDKFIDRAEGEHYGIE